MAFKAAFSSVFPAVVNGIIQGMASSKQDRPQLHEPGEAGEGDEPTHDSAGVDLTLIRWMLSMTPAERLQTLQHNIWSILRLRGDDPTKT